MSMKTENYSYLIYHDKPFAAILSSHMLSVLKIYSEITHILHNGVQLVRLILHELYRNRIDVNRAKTDQILLDNKLNGQWHFNERKKTACSYENGLLHCNQPKMSFNYIKVIVYYIAACFQCMMVALVVCRFAIDSWIFVSIKYEHFQQRDGKWSERSRSNFYRLKQVNCGKETWKHNQLGLKWVFSAVRQHWTNIQCYGEINIQQQLLFGFALFHTHLLCAILLHPLAPYYRARRI